MELLGVIDLTGSSADITDKGLDGIMLAARKADNKHFSISVNNTVIDFEIETNRFLPCAMYMPSEENLLTVKIGNREIYTDNLTYNGRIEKVELQRQDRTYMLKLLGRCDEGGPNNGEVGGTLILEQGIV